MMDTEEIRKQRDERERELFARMKADMQDSTPQSGGMDIKSIDRKIAKALEIEPQPFMMDMNAAMWLLKHLYERWHIEWNLYLDNDGSVACEIGFWSREAGERDEIWAAYELMPGLAIVNAVVQSPVFMGEVDDDVEEMLKTLTPEEQEQYWMWDGKKPPQGEWWEDIQP